MVVGMVVAVVVVVVVARLWRSGDGKNGGDSGNDSVEGAFVITKIPTVTLDVVSASLAELQILDGGALGKCFELRESTREHEVAEDGEVEDARASKLAVKEFVTSRLVRDEPDLDVKVASNQPDLVLSLSVSLPVSHAQKSELAVKEFVTSHLVQDEPDLDVKVASNQPDLVLSPPVSLPISHAEHRSLLSKSS
ncbi:hypothetical protein ACFX13_031260 [Malus domestica]